MKARKLSRLTIVFFSFLLLINPAAFSSESIDELKILGDEAISRRDAEQTLLLGQKIIAQDPHDLYGYQLILKHSLIKKDLLAFAQALEDAKKKGAPPLEVDYAAAAAVYGIGLSEFAIVKLSEFETAWRKKYDQQ